MQQEVLALIAVKRAIYFEERDVVDARDLMMPENTKWLRVSQEVMRAGFSECLRDAQSCKTKWNQILPEYKRISDYLCRSGRNVADYWDLSQAQRKEEGLPKQFSQEMYNAINDWYGARPQIQPPHVRDTLAPNDKNCTTHQRQQQVPDDANSEDDTEDPMDPPAEASPDAMDDSTPPRSPFTSTSTPNHRLSAAQSTGNPVPMGRPTVPPGIIPHVISSSGTSSYSLAKRPGNTAVKRKSVSGHAIIAEATKTTGTVMAQKMQDIAELSRDLERSKMEVQLKLFSEQMAYQREKDRRLYETAITANENARLSVMKQGEIVNCLAQLSTVLDKSFNTSSKPNMPGMPQQRTTHVSTLPTPGSMGAHTVCPSSGIGRSSMGAHTVCPTGGIGRSGANDRQAAPTEHSTGRTENDSGAALQYEDPPEECPAQTDFVEMHPATL